MENKHFSVFCTGYDETEGHVRYAFQVVHVPSGCSWKVHRRYREILAFHEQLAAGTRGSLPEFPPKALNGLSWMWGEDVPVKRVAAFQTYFSSLVARDDLTGNATLQALLGVEPPDPVGSVDVARWRLEEPGPGTVDVELAVSCDAFSPREPGSSPFSGTIENFKPVEEFVVLMQGASTSEPLAFAQPGEPLWVNGLPSGEELNLEVRARNGMGISEPVALNLSSPGERALRLLPGMRVRAVWAGDGATYDAVVKSIPRNSPDFVLLDWPGLKDARETADRKGHAAFHPCMWILPRALSALNRKEPLVLVAYGVIQFLPSCKREKFLRLAQKCGLSVMVHE
eukprot:s1143_g3.t1